jgi:hypothetical protein
MSLVLHSIAEQPPLLLPGSNSSIDELSCSDCRAVRFFSLSCCRALRLMVVVACRSTHACSRTCS